ncbi:ATP-binding cassette domain-containing protein [Streptomyces botrytidirepellens]|uniref:ABC-type xenobiotic transporter n=1 Tax=Streptomyces botrytidirepellens TaxID=2486417 RepID=A0A3M8VKZ8_9ACTN|nr:ATP-binding cassette domain-containing protein [Streptomyces botrytidirepellens]RNG18246.1 ATP-binding cassette domain-containing protein [Streptomyces botrytidirepellens]
MAEADGVPAVWMRGLRKSYGAKEVLAGIDLDVPTGSVFALLGPNGAGKTTTVHILSTLVQADDGQVRVAGHDLRKEPNAVRSAIGLTGQFAAVDKLLTGEENLRLIAKLRHLDRAAARRRIADLLELFELGDAAKKPLHTYSGGMRRKLDLALTLLDQPPIIFLDEPTTGLDPRSRQAMWDIVREVVAHGTTVFLTTQYLEEADRLADRIAVLDGGKLVAEGTSEELKARIGGGRIELRFADTIALDAAALAVPESMREEETFTLAVPMDAAGTGSIRAVLDQLDHARIEPLALSVQTPNLDDVFLALTGATSKKEGSATR